MRELRVPGLVFAVLALCGCGPTPVRPNTTVSDPAHGPRVLSPPPRATSTATIHLECNTTLEPENQDYVIDLVADHLDVCTVTNNRVALILEDGAHPSDQMQFEINPYNGPGTYAPTSFSVSKLIGGFTRGAQDCSGGTITVVDAAPGQALPKSMGFVVDCPRLTNSDTHVCSALSLNLRVDCP